MGTNWYSIVRSALGSLSLTWGGVGDVLVPTSDDGRPHPAFRRLLRAHDPDYISAYQATRVEQVRADPNSFDKWLATQPDQGTPNDELLARFEADVVALTGWWDARAAVAATRSVCAPYRSESGYFPPTRYNAPLDWPLVPLANFPHLLHAPLDLDLSNFDPAFELMVRMRIGAFRDGDEQGPAVQRLQARVTDALALSELACLRDVHHRPDGDSPIRHLQELHSTIIPPIQGVDPLSPMQRTRHGMVWVSFEPRSTWVVVVGESYEDFCFALDCDRLFLGATWLPSHLLGDPLLTSALSSLGEWLQLQATAGMMKVIATSVSLDADDVVAASTTALGSTPSRLEVTPPDAINFGRPRRLADPESLHLGESSACYVDERGSLQVGTAFATPIPEVARSGDPFEIVWEVDVDVEGAAAPPREPLGPAELLFRTADVGRVDVRSGAVAIAYHSHPISGGALRGWKLEQSLVRPSLRVPGAADVITRLATAAGLIVRPSQTGRLNQLMIDLWGDLGELAGDLAGPVWSLLAELAPSIRPRNGPRENSVVVNHLPYLTSAHARVLLGADEVGTRATLDRLLRFRVLRRGLVLGCERCNWKDWYSLDDLGQRFRCQGCTHLNLLELKAWRLPLMEPEWFYDLDHAVREGLQLNGRAPILALEELRRRSRAAFTYTTDFEIVRSGEEEHPPELDFAAVSDRVIVLGEAKTTARLACSRKEEHDKLDRLINAARDLVADEICLATTEEVWDDGTIRATDKACASAGIEVVYLSGLGHGSSSVGPPDRESA
jgi:hypothetical protein